MFKQVLKSGAYLTIFVLVLFPQAIASAEETTYWPEYGTTAEHNQWAIKEINADKTRAEGLLGQGVKVAILDSGVAATAPGLVDKIIAYKDFVPSQPPLQEHGTLTASSVAADLDIATGVSGSAPGASLIIGRVCYLSTCDNEAIRKAFNWAVDQGAQVISMSLGGGEDVYMNAAMLAATRKGVVVVAALGNQGCTPIAYWGMNRSCVLGKTTESYPSAHSIAGLISAGASDHTGARAGFSSWGPNLDLMAPGVDIAAYDPVSPNNGFGGTSAATPFIAGVAALVLSIKPDLRPAEVQAILQATAKPALETKPKVWDSCTKSALDGTWSCNAQVESDFPQQYFTGAGIVDAYAATELTKLIAAQTTLDAPSVSTSLQNISVSWTGGPADLYMNSKLMAKNATSYETSGNYFQSFSFQIRRGKQVSQPTLALLKNEYFPTTPSVTSFNARTDEILISTEDLSENLWQNRTNSTEMPGIFRFDDGKEIGCNGYSPALEGTPNRPYSFTCASATPLTNISGTFRLVNKYSQLSEPSAHLSAVASPAIKKIFVDTQYLSSDSIRFGWESVPGAKSYEYRYEPNGTLHCTDETFLAVSGEAPQPSVFWVRALAEPDCQGNTMIDSEWLGYRLLVATPPKPTGITVKEVTYTYTEFEVQNVDPKMHWRIYRSDGLQMRISPGQRFIVGMQPNEDVNGKTFSYRFMQVNMGMWGEVWSELSDPIIVKAKDLESPAGWCQYGIRQKSVECSVRPNHQVESTLIEYLDSEFHVLTTSSPQNSQHTIRTTKLSVPGASYVRLSSTTGVAPYWYRRGEGRLIKIANRGFATTMHIAR